jgi:hypothetical protein
VPDAEPVTVDDDGALIDWLKNRDAACPLCSYDLRGLVRPRCPECGQGLKLSVSLAEPYLKAWIALMAGLLPSAGVGTLFYVALCYSLYQNGLRDFMPGMKSISIGFAFAMVHVMSSVPLSILAIVFRRRFITWRRSLQIALASAAWVAVAVSISIMLSAILRL